MRKEPIFWGLYEETGAGDEPLAVDFSRSNIEYMKDNMFHGKLKVVQISFSEWVECLKYLDYDVNSEFENFLFFKYSERRTK